ncbi:hypothetical protein AV649_11655 [Rossellomorea marisflavi]|uniref:Uncharacterized protein n=1 Tax=Rossellomorea marisflavi TaxID=189381 RepID=A0A165LZE9_9BACI|nr:hypothetical protein AV649_11655 [Rossellomorea marisflavi]
MKIERKIRSYIGLTVLIIVYSTLVISFVYYIFELNELMLTAIIAFIGAIIGGLISGLLTLSGVNLTLRQQQAERLEEKYNIYNLIFSELLHKNIRLQTSMKSLNEKDFNNVIQDVYKSAEVLSEVSKQLVSQASAVNPETLTIIKSTIWVAEQIMGYIDHATENSYENCIIISTLIEEYYNRVAQNDVDLEECGRALRKKISEYEVKGWV